MRYASFILAIILLLSGIIGGSAAAQEDAQMVTGWCTIGSTNLRACPRWHNCANILTYDPDTLLVVRGTATGDTDFGSDQWLVVEDPVQGVQGYIHSTRAEECAVAPWQLMPVIPDVSDAMRAVYQEGIAAGNDPASFSKVGDCQNVEAFFLSYFDRPDEYDLGNFARLQSTIDQFAGSWARDSAAVEAGYTVASALSPLWADPEICKGNETPLACEDRLHNPSIVIISMETWSRDGPQPISDYEKYLGEVVEYWLGQGVIPILGTKADNLEGNNAINAAVARVATEYEVPLWNFWLAAQSLPGNGFDPDWSDGFHLLWARSFYNNPARLRDGWPVRNLTALQALDAVWRAVKMPGGSTISEPTAVPTVEAEPTNEPSEVATDEPTAVPTDEPGEETHANDEPVGVTGDVGCAVFSGMCD